MVLKEPELFDYLKEFHYQDLEKSPVKFDTYDCESKEHKMFIELKSRNTHYDELLVEQPKYQALMDKSGFLGLTPWYICATPSGVWGFDLSALPTPEWSEKWLPRNTEFSSSGNKTKVVGFLHIDKGILL